MSKVKHGLTRTSRTGEIDSKGSWLTLEDYAHSFQIPDEESALGLPDQVLDCPFTITEREQGFPQLWCRGEHLLSRRPPSQ